MRPSSFQRGGGGQLNDVDVTFQGYQFTIHDTGFEIKNGDRKGETFTPLNLVVDLLVDGATDPVSRRLLVGEATDYSGVSADGLTLELGDGKFSAKSEAGQFLDSLVEAGFDANEFDEDATTLNIEPVVGRRFRVVQVDVTDNKGVVKTHVGKNKEGKPVTYKDKSTRVSVVYPGVAVSAGKKAAGKAVAKTSAATKGKPAKAVDVSEEAAAALTEVVAAKGGVIPKAKLRMALLTALTGKTANRDAIIAYLGKDENLDGIEGVSYDSENIAIG
jgi:hypothetical protein